MSDLIFALNFMFFHDQIKSNTSLYFKNLKQFLCMIGMIWNHHFLSVKLTLFLQKKLYHFSSLLSLSMHSSFPVTLTTARLNTEYQKAAFFILHCEKSSQVAGVITVSLIIAWWPYCSASKKRIQVFFYGHSPLSFHVLYDMIVIDDVVMLKGSDLSRFIHWNYWIFLRF